MKAKKLITTTEDVVEIFTNKLRKDALRYGLNREHCNNVVSILQHLKKVGFNDMKFTVVATQKVLKHIECNEYYKPLLNYKWERLMELFCDILPEDYEVEKMLKIAMSKVNDKALDGMTKDFKSEDVAIQSFNALLQKATTKVLYKKLLKRFLKVLKVNRNWKRLKDAVQPHVNNYENNLVMMSTI